MASAAFLDTDHAVFAPKKGKYKKFSQGGDFLLKLVYLLRFFLFSYNFTRQNPYIKWHENFKIFLRYKNIFIRSFTILL